LADDRIVVADIVVYLRNIFGVKPRFEGTLYGRTKSDNRSNVGGCRYGNCRSFADDFTLKPFTETLLYFNTYN